MKLLDCTLRDGGYYNKWDFDSELVSDYLFAVAKSGVDYVELGLRQFKNDKFLGAHAYTTPQYLDRLQLPAGPVYGVMIDAKTILSHPEPSEQCIDLLFKDCIDEKIGLVRIAAHFHEVEECHKIANALKQKGYLVGLNIMQASLKSSEELTDITKLVNEWELVDVLYFADSLGSMDKNDMKRIYSAIREEWAGDIGFHAHNNMGQAVENVDFGIGMGCSWIDATVSGMGRGAGNAELEFVLSLPVLSNRVSSVKELDTLVMHHFETLKTQYGWGVSMAYFRSAQKGIHPTYIQELCGNNDVSRKQWSEIIEDIGRTENPNAYSKTTLKNVISKTSEIGTITGCSVESFMSGKEVVLVAQTDDARQYSDAIVDYVKAKDAILISINLPVNDKVPYDFCVISHNERYRADYKDYVVKNFEFIAPAQLFEKDHLKIKHNYGIDIIEGAFDLCGTYAVLPNRLTLSYAVAFCLEANANSISLAGFSGYSLDSKKQKEMQSLISLLVSKGIKMKSITPTTYAIPEASIHCV